MAAITPQEYARARRRMRGFLLVWIFLTLFIGFATFMAIYFSYPLSGSAVEAITPDAGAPSIALQTTPLATNTPSPTPLATNTPLPTNMPTEASTPTETPLPPTPLPVEDKRFQVGIQIAVSPDLNQDYTDGYYDQGAKGLGLSWVKHQVRWENHEVVQGQYDWSSIDVVMKSAQKVGVKMMLSVVTAPEWAREPGVNTERHGPPNNNADYTAFLTAILTRYPGQVHAMEIWNEMNLDREWTSASGLSATKYTAMLKASFEAIKAIDPGVIVISGALSPTGFDDNVGAIADFRYADLMISAGALNYMDCFGAHHNGINMPPLKRYNEGYNDPSAVFRGPFDNPHPSWSFRSTLEGYAQRITGAGSNIKLCVTEFGWPSMEDLDGGPRTGFEFAQDNTLLEQAEFIPEAMGFMEQSQFVWLAFIWNFNYAPLSGFDPKNDNVPYSLVGPKNLRPAYGNIRDWYAEYKTRAGLEG